MWAERVKSIGGAKALPMKHAFDGGSFAAHRGLSSRMQAVLIAVDIMSTSASNDWQPLITTPVATHHIGIARFRLKQKIDATSQPDRTLAQTFSKNDHPDGG